jgi:hypothetical protein
MAPTALSLMAKATGLQDPHQNISSQPWQKEINAMINQPQMSRWNGEKIKLEKDGKMCYF